MRLLYSLAIAISMYSRIPVPTVDWNEKNMKYAMCFFPVVGVITGLLQAGAGYLILEYTSFGKLFFAAVMTLIPVLVTGGIHLDGYADTIDALSSYGDREKKLQILKDPHTGAFAVIGLCVYFVAVLALWSEGRIVDASDGSVYLSFFEVSERYLCRIISGGKEQRTAPDISGRGAENESAHRAYHMGMYLCGDNVVFRGAAGR